MESNPKQPSVEELRAQAAVMGVTPSDADLEAVLGFLTRILPALEEIERELPPEIAPAVDGAS